MKGIYLIFKIHSKFIQNKISIEAVQLTKLDENFTWDLNAKWILKSILKGI